MSNIKVTVPDIGDIESADVIELHVAVGDSIDVDQPLITLESEKASMEVPATQAGTVTALFVKLGDKVSQGDEIIELELNEASSTSGGDSPSAEESASTSNQETLSSSPSPESVQSLDLVVPDLGDVDAAEIIECFLKEGESIEQEATMMVLESEKASMEVPATHSGVVEKMHVGVGDKVKSGMSIAQIKVSVQNKQPPSPSTQNDNQKIPTTVVQSEPPKVEKRAPVPDYPVQAPTSSKGRVHASPSVRRFARELGADLSKVQGSGPKNRILKTDVQSFIKYELSRPKVTSTTGSMGLPELPKVDFSKFGEIEEVALTRIQKVSSVALHRNWVTIPHVTQFEDADITELEAFRKSMKQEAEAAGSKLTVLAFVIKAVSKSLQAFPTFNASLAPDGENIILKKYYHIGVAVDTPDGLVVPVIRDVDKKSIYEIANTLGDLSLAARNKKLTADDMKGSCFTISSLGGVGGTSFTPIVNWPDVAILGLSRHAMKPVWNGNEFIPRLTLPMSLSYDHRVIDGAIAARFAVHLKKNLEDIRRVML